MLDKDPIEGDFVPDLCTNNTADQQFELLKQNLTQLGQ